MTQSKPSEEVTMRELIEKVFEDDHEGHVWWDAFKYTDCKVNIISDLEALFQQKLEEREKELIDKAREISHQKGYILNDIRFIKLEDLETLGGRK